MTAELYEPRGFALEIFKKRYAIRPDETWAEACGRVAAHVAAAEPTDRQKDVAASFERLLERNVFMPGGRIWYGSGRPKGQLLNCFIVPTADSREGWGKSVSDLIVVCGTGGGLGGNFSPVRPRGSSINGTGGIATGAVSLMEIWDAAGNILKAGGGRRTALMQALNLTHGDIREFLDKKLVKKKKHVCENCGFVNEEDISELQNANVSVVFSDNPEDFFKKVKKKEDFELIFRGRVVGKLPAAEIWKKIVSNALKSGEPGLLNGYLANRMNNIWYYKPVICTNPCGEVWLIEYDCCDLGALVLPRFVVETNDGSDVDWKLLRDTITTAVRFLDDVLTVNNYPLPEIKETCTNIRRIGLGVMGLHDMLLQLGLRYDSDVGLEKVDSLMNFIKNRAYEASVELAREKGPFPKFEPEHFLRGGFVKTLKPSLRSKIKEHGIRNCALLTIAPTGTTSMVSAVSSGIEPMFAPAYRRKYRDGDELKEEIVVHPLLQEFVAAGRKIDHFQGAFDIRLRDHFEMQRTCQRHLDNACSKCLATGTLILTNRGLVPIEDFSDVEGDDAFAEPAEIFYTSRGERITRHYRMGFGRATRIRLNNGAELVAATDTHRIMTLFGWKLMRELTVGDMVVGEFRSGHGPGNMEIDHRDAFLSNARKIGTSKSMSTNLAEWLGMLASDGCTNEANGGVNLCWKEKPEVRDRFVELSRLLFDVAPRLSVDQRNGVEGATITSRNLVRFVRSLIGSKARDKHVPRQILMGSADEKLAFLRGLTLDGSRLERGLCVYAGISYDLAYGAAEMCRSFGLPNVIFGRAPYVNPGEHVYSCTVNNRMQELIVPIEFHKRGPAVMYDYLVGIDRSVLDTHIATDHVHCSAVRALKKDERRAYCKSRLAAEMGWSTRGPVYAVTHVEDAGVVEMYDIEVEGSHSYIVNGMLSHNTINLTKDTSEEELSDLYMEFFPELKGVTVYPDGSRADQPLTPIPLEEAAGLARATASIEAEGGRCRSGVCEI